MCVYGMDPQVEQFLDGHSLVSAIEFMKLLDKWMDLGDIILSEVTQSQKNTHSLIGGY